MMSSQLTPEHFGLLAFSTTLNRLKSQSGPRGLFSCANIRHGASSDSACNRNFRAATSTTTCADNLVWQYNELQSFIPLKSSIIVSASAGEGQPQSFTDIRITKELPINTTSTRETNYGLNVETRSRRSHDIPLTSGSI